MGAAVMKNEDDVIGNEITGGNKTYHVYTALAGRRRQYYCSYHCFKQRPNPKNKL